MPVTLSLDSLTVDRVQYGSLQYGTTSITATGPAFPSSVPKTLTTHVKYNVGFDLGLGVYFSLSACKVFSFSFQGGGPNLSGLLGLNLVTPNLSNSVSTGLETSGPSCVLVPELIFKFNKDYTLTNVAVTGTVSVASPYMGPLTVALTTDTPQPNFPSSVSMPSGQSSATFS